MNNDLISREALKKRLQDRHDFWVNAWGGFSDMPLNDKSRLATITRTLQERRCGMIFPDNCKNCKIGYAIKCESGKEYICCDSIQKCQQEKKKGGAV